MAVIEFLNRSNKTLVGLRKAIEYITSQEKTEHHLIWGKDCNPDNAYIEMITIKRNYGKDTGRQFIHFVQSFSPYDRLTPETANEIARKLLELDCFKGFQIVTATHIDKDHIHNHFIINTVNYETSYKWQQNPKDLQRLKNYSDKLCRQYGLMVIPSMDKSNYTKAGEYRSTRRGMSWKYELYLAVNECIRNSTSKQEFINNMEKLGYGVRWTDTRKYITFTTPSGKKCRNNKLYKADELTKEKIQSRLELNARYANKRELQQRMDNILNAVAILLSSRSNNQGNSKNHKDYPLSKLEGDTLIERIAELKKGRGLDWDNLNTNNYER
ncbi:MAG: relaxase/mobilization nuclease domain-containing protein [Clostridia bacterium]|nr:relaxase/mobilization nuclease domain-containing protein [Clostridia bacterium]